jgi:hypothetical protein
MAATIKTAEMGRVKKMEKLPWERSNDWRKLFSMRGLNTMAMISGADS